MPPRISILIPARNRAGYIRAAVGSVLRQSFVDLELIVVDDGSTDDTYAIAREAVAGDGRAQVIRTAGLGVCAALNTAARVASGDYLGWVDSDDALAPEALSRSAAVLTARPDVGMVYTQHLVMDAEGTVLGLGRRSTIPYSKERLLVDFMTFHFRLMRRALFERLGGVDETIPYAEDYDLCLRLSEITTIAHVPEPLYLYRVHDQALSKTHRAEQVAASRIAVERALARRGLAERFKAVASGAGQLSVEPRSDQEARPNPSEHSVLEPRPTLELGFMEETSVNAELDAGVVSCLCVTRGNHRHLERAIRCFRAQTYRRCVLVLVFQELDEGAKRLLARRSEGIELVHVPKTPRLTLGDLRNVSLRFAQGDFVCCWDDDDWHSPRRVELQLRALLRAGADACLLSRLVILDEVGGGGYLSSKRPWEGSLLCRRELAVLQAGYPSLDRGEDRELVERLCRARAVAALDCPELYVYTHHGSNTWDASHFGELTGAATPLSTEDTARVRQVIARLPALPEESPALEFRSSVEGTVWPAVTTGGAAELLALQRQLDESQWWSPERLRREQFRQLCALVAHAAREVPFYAERLARAGIAPGTELTEATWARLPVLTRREVQELGDRLNASVVPASHGDLTTATSGGSSGVPVRVRKTALAGLLWQAIHVREELWHRENPRGTMARIRRVPPGLSEAGIGLVRSPAGLLLPDWGPPTNQLWRTGALGVMDDRVSIPDQAAFLRRLAAEYLFTFPSNLRLLLAHFRDDPAPFRSLRAVWTMSEVVDEPLRAFCWEVFGCRIVHNYSSSEAGYLALQCPASSAFHVQSEVVLLEVLDVNGRPCLPGEIGRVVVTPLHQFATPLLRYETGDEAEVGEPCGCGRGLPVLRRIVGRTYEYLKLPGGGQRRVDTGYYRLCAIPCVREFQLVQRSLELIELRLVLTRPLTVTESQQIQEVLVGEFGAEFRFEVIPVDAIERTESGKLRSFVSEV